MLRRPPRSTLFPTRRSSDLPGSGSPARPRALPAASSTCSGREEAASSMPWESSAERAIWRSGLERGLHALGLGLGHEALVLGVGDGLGLVDEHDRDVVADRVAALQTR